MATSPNYSWPEPDNTDLVKNGALAIRTLGNAIDTTMATMTPKSIYTAKGSIAAATAASTPANLSVGANNTVLQADSTTATGLKYSTPAVVVGNIVTAKGDVIAATASGTVTNLAVGTNGQVLTADSTTATGLKWATAGSSGAVTQIADTTLASAAADITFSSIPNTYNHLMVVISGQCSSGSFNGTDLSVQINSDTGTNYKNARNTKYAGAGATVTLQGASANKCELGDIWVGTASANSIASVQMTFPNYKATTLIKTMMFFGGGYSDAPATGSGFASWNNTSAITTLKIFSSGAGNLAIGTRATLYGLV